MIPQKNRLNRSAVAYALKKGYRLSNEYFIIKYIPSRGKENRYSVSVSLKVLPNAVARNTLRRRLYEILRKAADTVPSVFNIIIILKPPAAPLTFENLKKNLLPLLKKIHG